MTPVQKHWSSYEWKIKKSHLKPTVGMKVEKQRKKVLTKQTGGTVCIKEKDLYLYGEGRDLV